MRCVALRREIGERSCGQDPADAEPEDVDLALAGRLLDRVERGERPFEHVVLEILVREVGARVDPGDHERGVPLIDAPFDEAVLRLQIEDVELVDPGRHDQERALVHLRGGRRVLDQLHQIVLVDHLAGRGGDVLADLERLLVGHADLQAPSAPLEVGEQVLEAIQQVLAAGLLGFAQDRRIGQDEVARRDRADELPGVEVDLLLVLGIEPGDVADQRAQPAGAEQVRLPDVVEQEILGPGLVLEAPVAALGLDQRFGRRCLACAAACSARARPDRATAGAGPRPAAPDRRTAWRRARKTRGRRRSGRAPNSPSRRPPRPDCARTPARCAGCARRTRRAVRPARRARDRAPRS